MRGGGAAMLLAATALVLGACELFRAVDTAPAIIELRDAAGEAPVSGALVSVLPLHLTNPEDGTFINPNATTGGAGPVDEAGRVVLAVPTTHPVEVRVYLAGEPVRSATFTWRGDETDWTPLVGGDEAARVIEVRLRR